MEQGFIERETSILLMEFEEALAMAIASGKDKINVRVLLRECRNRINTIDREAINRGMSISVGYRFKIKDILQKRFVESGIITEDSKVSRYLIADELISHLFDEKVEVPFINQ